MAKMLITPEELELCEALSFDPDLIELIKKHTGSPIEQLPSFDEEGGQMPTSDSGICSETDEEESYDFIESQKEHFRKEGYLLFLFEDDDERKCVGVLKSKDEFDIIRYRKTNGVNHELETERIIQKLADWKNQYDFFIVGVGLDWIMAGFVTLPDDLPKFSKELYKFSPDVIDQGEGDVSDLEKQIEEAMGFFLWWD